MGFCLTESHFFNFISPKQSMKKNVALVLSSGGCRGLAHIGVIEEFLKDGYKISSIAGSSIGALIGGVYSSGNLEKFKEWVCNLDEVDVFDLMDFTIAGQGFIKADRFFQTLEKFIGCKTFEELRIPLVVVATDIVSSKEVIFDKGNLLHSIKASVSLPSFIPPVTYKNMILVDGGVINPIPVNCAIRTGEDILVVVDVNANIPYERPMFSKIPRQNKRFSIKRKVFGFLQNSMNFLGGERTKTQIRMNYLRVLDKTFDIMQDRICMLSICQGKPDWDINVSRNAATTFEFYRAQELIEAGRRAYHACKNKITETENNEL
jgi:NTE family protein